MTNLTQNGLIRMDSIVGIDYNDNIQDAINLIERTALGVEGVLREDSPYATVDELGTSTVNIKVFFWAETNDYKKGVVVLKGSIMQAVTKTLLDNGFGLPADIQELMLYDYQKDIPVRLLRGTEDKENAPLTKVTKRHNNRCIDIYFILYCTVIKHLFMKISLARAFFILSAVLLMASCSSSKKKPSTIGKVIILKEGKAAGKDNGLHKGWYKNPNNPHHPRTTNPGHTKSANGKTVKGGKGAKGKKK